MCREVVSICVGFPAHTAVMFMNSNKSERNVRRMCKFPAFLGDFYEFRKQAGRAEGEIFDGDAPVPLEKPQSPERSRERKINSGR